MNSFIIKSLIFFFVIGLVLYNFAPETYKEASAPVVSKTGVKQETLDGVFSNSTSYIKEKAQSATKE